MQKTPRNGKNRVKIFLYTYHDGGRIKSVPGSFLLTVIKPRASPQFSYDDVSFRGINIATENKMATYGGDIPSTNDPSSASGASNGDQSSANANFECNICLDTAKDAVISFCGHLFW